MRQSHREAISNFKAGRAQGEPGLRSRLRRQAASVDVAKRSKHRPMEG